MITRLDGHIGNPVLFGMNWIWSRQSSSSAVIMDHMKRQLPPEFFDSNGPSNGTQARSEDGGVQAPMTQGSEN